MLVIILKEKENAQLRVNLTVIFESAIIAELDLGVYVCGHGKLTLLKLLTQPALNRLYCF